MTQTRLKHAVTKMCVYVCVTVSRAVMSKQGLDWLILPGATRLLFHEHHTQTVRVAITSFSFSFVSLYLQQSTLHGSGLKTQILSNDVPKIHHVFWPAAGKEAAIRLETSTGESVYGLRKLPLCSPQQTHHTRAVDQTSCSTHTLTGC